MDQSKREPVKMYHPVEEKSSPYSLVEHATKSTDTPKTTHSTKPELKPITSHSASYPPIPVKTPTLHTVLEPIPKTPTPTLTSTPVHGALYPPIPNKSPTLHNVLEPIPLTPPIFEGKKKSSASLLHSTTPPNTFYPISPAPNTFYPISPAPILRPIPVHGAPYPPVPKNAPTLHTVLEPIPTTPTLHLMLDPIPEESNNDLIENEKGQKKANEDVQEIFAEKIDPTFVHDAQPIATNAKEARRMVNEDYKKRLEDAKNEHKELGGLSDYGDLIKDYKKAIQALKYKNLLNSEESKNLNDKEKEQIFKFYNKNYKDEIQAKNKLRIDILRRKFNKYTF